LSKPGHAIYLPLSEQICALSIMAQTHDIIVIGGGGLEGVKALEALLADLPFPFPAAILVAIDARPERSENILSRLVSKTRLTVTLARPGDLLQAGWVYLTPQDWHMMLDQHTRIVLNQNERLHCKRPAADLLLLSAAKCASARTIGVTLSGSYADGAAGLRRISAIGGLSVTQAPSTTDSLSMPLNVVHQVHPSLFVRTAGARSFARPAGARGTVRLIYEFRSDARVTVWS
jgi:two-component system chemotaxis response regulator CheB